MMEPDPDELRPHGAIAARLVPLRPAPARADALRCGVLERVRRSALAHREYVTVRREDGEAHPGAGGTTSRTLWASARMRVEIVRLDAGAALPWPADATAQELLVLDGALTGAGAQPVGRHAYGVRQRGEGDAPLRAVGAVGASTVYVRQRLVEPRHLPALEARWWGLASPSARWVDPSRRRWAQTSPGVEVLSLRGDRDVVSMLVRFAPGAAVADHHHALDEDCLVLEGEMFLGDILLRTGDYQLAPAGGSHFGECSDVGVLFFFHGALDPVLRG